MKNKLQIILIIVFSLNFLLVNSAKAASMDDILKRLDKLEQENKLLRSEVENLKQNTNLSQNVESNKTIVTTKSPVNLKVYGFAEGSGIYSDSQGGESIMNAPVETGQENDNEFDFTARGTRLGFNFNGPDIVNSGKISGKVETDFFSGSETTPEIRVRQAYVKLAYPTWDVLAGQTWDFFAPLNPSTLNRGCGFRSGNLGHRHPQLLITKNINNIFDGNISATFGAC